MSEVLLYPLQFTPELKEKVWGGSQLVSVLNKEGEGTLGESWELSSVPGSVSKVANGALQGSLLTDVIAQYKEALVGEHVYKRFGTQFPLLFKFIDASQDLSVQLHPDDTLAQERHNSFGKTEMWYVLNATEEARLILGFQKKLTKETYTKALEAGTITSVLHSEQVTEGASFFIAPGMVHAIGAGVLLAEIQQTSDITYRIYDWDRPDTNGQLRALHTEEALEAINFEANAAKITYIDAVNERILLKECPYFVTNKLWLTEDFAIPKYQTGSCKVYMCVAGNATIVTDNNRISVVKGQTVLVPACFESYTIETKNTTLLEVYIPE